MLTRRRLLKTMVVTAGSVSAASLLAACHDHADAGASIDAATVFPQSVASGDPRPNSVVLWTRVEVAGAGVEDQDARVGLEVSRDASFSSLIVGEYFTAPAAHDHCLKVRVAGLEPGTIYYYRFLHGRAISKTGRTRTAPAENADTEIKFAFLSCQDYIGRYYNAYLMLLEQDPDFVVFLGDYIYETTGDAEFQNTGSERNITFDDSDGALKIGPADSFYYAAASLDNYRQLYRVYRQDPLLQQVHELYPFINTWDDHEYSDDCWGDSSTYYDGATNEPNLVRRRNAEQAYFEFTPLDQFSVADELTQQKEALSVSDTPLYPDARIFRDFRFGRHMHLFMTDFRSYRPDHLVPEDAFPGSVVYDQAQLEAYYTSVGTDFADVASLYSSYVNIDAAEHADRKTALEAGLRTAYQAAFTAKGLDLVEHADRIEQLVAVGSTGNIIASQLNLYLSDALKLGDGEISSLSKGLGFATMGKNTLFSDVGARYFVIKPVFDVFATLKTLDLGTPSVYGDAQTEWLTSGLRASTATWKLVGSSVSFSPLILDLAAPPLPFIQPLFSFVPQNFRQAFYFDVDDWDGFPVQKQALLRGVLGETGAITIAGDVHSSYVCEHPAVENGKRSFDFTGGAISSGTWGEFTESAAQSVSPALAALVPRLDEALVEASSRDLADSQVKFASTSEHAVSIMRVNAAGATVDFHLVPSTEGSGENKVSVVGTRYYDNAAAYLAKRRKITFAVVDGQLQGPI